MIDLGMDSKSVAPQVPVIKLTKWENEPTVSDLKDDLETTKPSQTTYVTKLDKWTNLRDCTGPYKPKDLPGRSKVQPKLVRRQAEWRYSALSEAFLSAQKLYKVDPATFEDEHGAKQNEVLLNWQFRTKMNKIKFIDEYVRTGVDEGTIMVELGWFRQTKKIKEIVPEIQYIEPTPEEVQILEAAYAQKQANLRSFDDMPIEMQAALDYLDETGVPTVAVIAGETEVESEEIIENKPTVTILNPKNVFIDPSCEGDITKAKFAIVSFETSKADLMKDGRYKNLKSVNWSSNNILSQPDHDTNTPNDVQVKDDLRRPVVAYKYYGFYDIDKTGELQPIVATWIGDVMIRMERNPFPDEQIPIVIVPYLPVKRQLTGEPDAEILEDNQSILGAVYRGMIDLMGRSANAQQGFAKGFLDVINRRRFEKGQDYEFNPGTGDPRLSVYQHSYPEIPQSAMMMVGLQNQEAEALTGVKAFAGGLSGESYGDVVAAIKGVLDAAAKREMNILRRLAAGMQEIGQKIIAMNAVFMSEEEVIRVTNREYVTIKRKDLKGRYDLVVDINTAEMDEARAQDLGFILQTMGPNMPPGMANLILSDIADLKRMPALAEKIRTFKPEPDPLVVRLQELEIAKLEAEVEKIKSETTKNMANAEKLSTEADLNNLEHVEEETGTKHARDMQRTTAQAQANQDLEVTKSFLKSRKPEESSPDIEAAIGYNALVDAQQGNPF